MRFGTRYRGVVDQVEASTTGLICASPVGLLIPFLQVQVGDRAQSRPTLRHWHGPLTKESKASTVKVKLDVNKELAVSLAGQWSNYET